MTRDFVSLCTQAVELCLSNQVECKSRGVQGGGYRGSEVLLACYLKTGRASEIYIQCGWNLGLDNGCRQSLRDTQ